jgi:monoamine oxidase
MTAALDKTGLDTVIVGGGLCGLALADSLQTLGRDWALYEARPRLGGRICSQRSAATGAMVDLGPTWFWPHADPLFTELVGTLGLANFRQHDDGTIVELKAVDKSPERLGAPDLHGGAQRLAGGMAALVEALAARLPAERLRLEHTLLAVADRGEHVELTFRHGEALRTVLARRVVLAVPPRLLEKRVSFTPDLPATLRRTMRDTPTWMASAAKAVVAYPSSYWRSAGHSGNAFVSHEQAVLAEIFDACADGGDPAALGGFLVLSPAQRESFQRGLPMLIHSQITQVFGEPPTAGELHYQDWAGEEHTCCDLDRSDPAQGDHPYGNLLLIQALWDDKLYLGGAETAGQGGGRLEGALVAAMRLRRALSAVPP